VTQPESAVRNLVSLALLLTALLAAYPALAESDEPPLHNEDVVMMLVGGENPARVIDVIRARVTEFDLSDEMMTELGLAGVPAEVVRAMRERQAEIDGPAEPVVDEGEPTAPAESESGFRVTIEDADVPEDDRTEGTFMVVLPALLTGPAAARLELPEDEASRTIARAAIAIACVEPRHAPDHWRAESPLGRDFFFTPRHKLVRFEVGTTSTPDPVESERPTIEVTFPTTIEGPLDGPEHRLLIGLAVEVGDRWYLIRSIDLGESPTGRESSRFDARIRIRASRSATLEQELERVDSGASEDVSQP
jgi:hypothetical protein